MVLRSYSALAVKGDPDAEALGPGVRCATCAGPAHQDVMSAWKGRCISAAVVFSLATCLAVAVVAPMRPVKDRQSPPGLTGLALEEELPAPGECVECLSSGRPSVCSGAGVQRRLTGDGAPRLEDAMEERMLQGSPQQDAKALESWLDRGNVKELKTWLQRGRKTGLQGPEVLETAKELQAFLSGHPVKGQCPNRSPVLSASMTVTLQQQELPSELFLPLLLRVAKDSFGRLMRTTPETVMVNIGADGTEEELLSLQEAVGLGAGKKFQIIAEVTDPSMDAMVAASGKDFPKEFHTQVSGAMMRQGAAEGVGDFHTWADFAMPQMQEKNSYMIQGKFKSLGLSTACQSKGQVAVEDIAVHSLRHCSASCALDSGCHGFQFYHNTQACHLWKGKICHGQEFWDKSKRSECFVKCG